MVKFAFALERRIARLLAQTRGPTAQQDRAQGFWHESDCCYEDDPDEDKEDPVDPAPADCFTNEASYDRTEARAHKDRRRKDLYEMFVRLSKMVGCVWTYRHSEPTILNRPTEEQVLAQEIVAYGEELTCLPGFHPRWS